MKYRSLPSEIEAEQFLPPHKIPNGVMNVYEMNEGWYTGEVWTIQGEKVRVKHGEWIVQEPLNPERYYPIADETFRKKYVESNGKEVHQTGWVSVKDRLPEENTVVLVAIQTLHEKWIETAFFGTKTFQLAERGRTTHVGWWMPLPAHP